MRLHQPPLPTNFESLPYPRGWWKVRIFFVKTERKNGPRCPEQFSPLLRIFEHPGENYIHIYTLLHHSELYPSINCSFIRLFINSFIHFVYLSTYSFVYLFVYLFTYLLLFFNCQSDMRQYRKMKNLQTQQK